MKKLIVLLMVGILAMGSIVGCAKKTSNGSAYNKEFSTEMMTTVAGEEINIKDTENIFADKVLGFGFIKPAIWESISGGMIDQMVELSNAYNISYISETAIERMQNIDYSKISEEEAMAILEEVYSREFKFMCVYKVYEGSPDEAGAGGLLTPEGAEELQKAYSNTVSFGTIDKDTYYLSYNTELPPGDWTEKDKENINALAETVDEFRKNIILFPANVEQEEENLNGDLNKFTTTDMSGNQITEELLKDYDITMVNIWTTWCGYCVEEMPELEELYQTLPENVNMITICADAADETELANEILKQSNASFTTLVGNEELEKCLLSQVAGFPTTVFVDSEGNVVSDVQVGAPAGKGEIVEGYTNLIHNALSASGK